MCYALGDMSSVLEFEKPIASLEEKLAEMRQLTQEGPLDLSDEIRNLEKKISSLQSEVFDGLDPWQRVQLSRHPQRPYTLDYIPLIFENFDELKGDRRFGDDPALIAGFAELNQQTVVILGHQKGRSTKEKMQRNFGMARPEGYRKAIRLMELANRFGLPLITFIDTPGAHPSIEAEERGQSQAVAESILKLFELEVPILSVVIGEGGSGGALAIGVANRVLMQEHSTYSVISPEGCASILWGDATQAAQASAALKMNASELLKLGIIDEIVPEPAGGAHRDTLQAAQLLKSALEKHLNSFSMSPEQDFRSERLGRYRHVGASAYRGEV